MNIPAKVKPLAPIYTKQVFYSILSVFKKPPVQTIGGFFCIKKAAVLQRRHYIMCL